MSALRIAVRCDGDATIGAGHVGRCLPLARALQRAGIDVTFVGAYGGVAESMLDTAGFEARPATRTPAGIPSGADGAIVDVYGVPDEDLAAAARSRPLIAFTDQRQRTIDGVTFLDYHLDAAPTGLAGPDFAPIDPQFVAARHRSSTDEPILVALGGSGSGREILPPLVDAVLAGTARDIHIAGEATIAPDERVQSLGPLPGLAATMSTSSAIVCGAGVTAYEAACAGVPALLVVLADNQERVARAFTGLTPTIDARHPVTRAALEAVVGDLLSARVAAAGPALVDGLGSVRVREALVATINGAPRAPIQRYRPATWEDAALLLSWRSDERTRLASRTTHEISVDEHREWMGGVLADPDRTLLLVERERTPVASVRFDRAGADSEISIAVDPRRQGRGIGRQAIIETTELELAARPGVRRVVAETRGDNSTSIRAFEAAGYRHVHESNGWVRFEAVG